jgi:nucleoside-diphosphate kinase
MLERTLVILKPQAIKRGLVGLIIGRLEKVGEMIECRLITATRMQLDRHFPNSSEWLCSVGKKALQTCRDFRENPLEVYGSEELFRVGIFLREKGIDIYLAGKIIVMILEGEDIIRKVRCMIGNTLPYRADQGTIRRDFCEDPLDRKYARGAFDNLIHASGDREEADNEINVWFP